MFTVYKKQLDWGGRQLTLETGKMARQADGAVMVTYGETVVMATACFQKTQKEGMDFFPLTVNYQEKFYAGGRIPGGFFKREGRPTEHETLTSRLIDRPLRPLFHPDFKNETQVICNVLSMDSENEADIAAMVGASAALTLSGAPFMGPIAGARIGYVDGDYVLNPQSDDRAASDLNLVVAGTREGVLMVESEAKELSEEVMLGAVTFGHEKMQPVIDAIIELAEAAAKPGFDVVSPEGTEDMLKAIQDKFGKDIQAAYSLQDKQERQAKLAEVRDAAMESLAGDEGEKAQLVKGQFKQAEANVLRGSLLKTKNRIDGRGLTDIRPIVAEVDVLPRVHGSALFTRGETQALVVTTLGNSRDEQLIDAVEGEYKDNFMLHYNFPSFSVGEVGRMMGPGRREIGHGRLARRALSAMLPTREECPYTIRVVSEITESNGSSSMATVCGTSMALMASGVPMARPVSGIAMGLIKEDDDFAVLSDILGDEDHLGDMDFKVAGTEEGITALQMDLKITSITPAIMKQALEQAKGGRLHILEKMAKAITESRVEVSDSAPGMDTMQINKDKIRDVIGSGGKVIRGLIEETGCAIDINEEGVVTLTAVDRKALKECRARIEEIIAEPELNTVYNGKVMRVEDYGVFVRYLGQHEALLHVSEMLPVRISNVRDLFSEGDTLNVKVTNLNDRGRVRLTMLEVEQDDALQTKLDEYVEKNQGQSAPAPRGDKDDKDGNRRDNRRPRRNSA